MKLNFLKKTLLAGVCALTLVGCGEEKADQAKAGAAADAKTLAITAIVEHPALDAVRAGAIEQLAAEGFKEGENLKVNFQSAQGNMGTAGQIAKQFAADRPDAVLAIATPSAQAMVAATTDVPVIFSAVTDPVEAKLVEKLQAPGANVTGASDAVSYDAQVALIKEIIPAVKRVGFVYNPGEVNSNVALKKLKENLEPQGIEVVESPAQKSSDITMAAKALVGKVDVIYTSADNMVVSAYEALYQVAKEAKIPLISENTDMVERGAIAGLGVNFNELGKETGKIISRVLKGEQAGSIDVFLPQQLELIVSKKHAQEQGVELPQTILERAAKVHE